ncbi:hypothetical protein SAY86_009725 [Trapa natans]|uniref:Uncharacterized protein n=1 Tax=Trapa natans TaxID=22666 RepID=A0AAN7L4F2_TRANT|nr:hypothetical protein SAY86_009725 [Trapa natans]
MEDGRRTGSRWARWEWLPKRAGLNRCGKSCRLRWLNNMRPDIRRGNISPDEEELILRLHRLLGNRWSLIAGRLPGRTGYEIKTYWNSTFGKRVKKDSSKKLYIPEAQRHTDIGKNKLNAKLQGDDNTGIRRNPIQSSTSWEKQVSMTPAAFWASMLEYSNLMAKAQASIQRDEHENYSLGINNGEQRLHLPSDGETTVTSRNMGVESYRSRNILSSGFHRGDGTCENAIEDPLMNLDVGVDLFLKNLLNTEMLGGRDPSSLASLADLLNSEIVVDSNLSFLPSSDAPTSDLDGKN